MNSGIPFAFMDNFVMFIDVRTDVCMDHQNKIRQQGTCRLG